MREIVGCGGVLGRSTRGVPSVVFRPFPTGEIDYHHDNAAQGAKQRQKRPCRPFAKRSGDNLRGRYKEQDDPDGQSD